MGAMAIMRDNGCYFSAVFSRLMKELTAKQAECARPRPLFVPAPPPAPGRPQAPKRIREGAAGREGGVDFVHFTGKPQWPELLRAPWPEETQFSSAHCTVNDRAARVMLTLLRQALAARM